MKKKKKEREKRKKNIPNGKIIKFRVGLRKC